MTFEQFCRAHGVIVPIGGAPLGRWARFKTEDKPRSKNGAVKYMGTHGFVQNHATMIDVAVWRSESSDPEIKRQAQRVANDADRQIKEGQAKAAKRAAEMLAQATAKPHPYLESKGFPLVAVMTHSEGHAMIPMRVGGELVGVQIISENGTKRFLYGQRCDMATFVMQRGNGGVNVVCEGYATGLSTSAALISLRQPFNLHVCFSAGNMQKVASTLRRGVCIADNDESGTGERVAIATGWPYWMSDAVGEDANDYHVRKGLFSLSQGIKQKLMLR